MCKVFAMTNMSKVKITKKFLSAVKNEVCRTGDKHGFGYAVLNEDGSIGGERTMRPLDWQPLQGSPSKSRTGSLPIILQTRDEFGKTEFDAKSFVGHGRYSTNEVSLENTHPFYNGELALIHNGVVRDPDMVIDQSELQTSNDTEILLRCWEKGGMKKIESTVTGYYALAILDKSGLLHIIRDDQAMLYIAYNKTVDSFMIATTAEIIKAVAKKMQWAIEMPEELLANIHVIFDRNEILSQADIEPRVEVGRTMSRTELTALGRAGFNDLCETSEGGVFDATIASMIEQDEPSYRKDKDVPLAYATALESGDIDRQLMEDGAPNSVYRLDYSDDNGDRYGDTEISGYEMAYNRRKIS